MTYYLAYSDYLVKMTCRTYLLSELAHVLSELSSSQILQQTSVNRLGNLTMLLMAYPLYKTCWLWLCFSQ